MLGDAGKSARPRRRSSTLESLGVLLQPFVCTRVDYQEAAREGLRVTEIMPYGKAADEMRALWSSVKRRLGRLKSQEKPARKAA